MLLVPWIVSVRTGVVVKLVHVLLVFELHLFELVFLLLEGVVYSVLMHLLFYMLFIDFVC